jgi:Magnesium chelatase, subunit ChlI
MLARRLTTILPDMTLAEAIETMRNHRVAGCSGDRTAVVTTRPFWAPHHTISDVGLIGGGQVPRPGEVSLAHHGCCFWMSYRRAGGMSSRSCANPSRTASLKNHVPYSVDPHQLVTLAMRVESART